MVRPLHHDSLQTRILSQPALPELINLTSASSATPELDRTLLRTFTNYTALSLSDRTRVQRAWAENIPRLALSYPFLAHGVLSMGALHLSRLHQNKSDRDAGSYFRKATNKFNQCLPIFRKTIQNHDDDNCEALFIFASFVVVFLFATASDDCHALLVSLPCLTVSSSNSTSRRQKESEVGSAMLSRHLQTFQALRGSLFIIEQYFPRIKRGLCSDICSRDYWPEEPLSAALEQVKLGARVQDARLISLQVLWKAESPDVKETLDTALDELRLNFALVACLTEYPSALRKPLYNLDPELLDKSPVLTDRSAVLVFPTKMLLPFLKLLDQHNKAALMLLAYYGVLLDRVGGMWWSKNTGKHIALAVALILGQGSRDWLEWPIAYLGLEEIWEDEKQNPDGLKSPLKADSDERFTGKLNDFLEQSTISMDSLENN